MDPNQSELKFNGATLKLVLSILSPLARKKSVWIIVLVIVNALLDFLSVAAFLPLLIFVVKPDGISAIPFVETLYTQLGFSSAARVIIGFAVFLFLIIGIKNLVTRWIAMKKASYAFGISEDLSSRGIVRYLEMSYLDFSEGDFTRALNRIVNYPFAFANHVILPLTTLVSELFVSVLILGGIAIYDWRIASVLALLIIPIVLLYQLRREKLKSISKSLKEKYPLLMKYTLQVIEGFSEIKSTQTEHYFHQRFQTVSGEMSKVFAKDQLIQSGTSRLTEVVVTLLICALIVCSVSFQQNYQETLMLLGVYAGAGFRMIPSINRILQSTQQIRLHEHLLEELEPLSTQSRNEFSVQTERLSFNDSIDLRNISFAYLGQGKTLDNVSLCIRKGEKVALTGVSGGGKTTLLLILLRFLKESTGELMIDGNRINNDRAWRRLLGYVPQNPYVLDGSIAENIAFGIPQDLVDRKKIHQLLDDLGLADMVNQQTNGIDTQIGERGVKLSGGQRQRLAIARVLYADAEILLLDEITNQVHTFMEKEILNILHNLSLKKKTIVMVTHHITNSQFFDSIYTLESGTLREIALQNV
jgi:ATP-binding cassette, subfamily B, bacterial PglK